jgi:hypothetical protein
MTSTTPMNEPHGYKDPKTHKQDWNNPGKPKIKFDKKKYDEMIIWIKISILLEWTSTQW